MPDDMVVRVGALSFPLSKKDAYMHDSHLIIICLEQHENNCVAGVVCTSFCRFPPWSFKVTTIIVADNQKRMLQSM